MEYLRGLVRRHPYAIPVAIALGLVILWHICIANAHDSWISHGQLRNPGGEWCCGPYDCGIVTNGDKSPLKAVRGGFEVHGIVSYGAEVTGNPADGPTRTEPVDEFWPYSEVMPSPDGAIWRCKRPDGTPRCKFANSPTG